MLIDLVKAARSRVYMYPYNGGFPFQHYSNIQEYFIHSWIGEHSEILTSWIENCENEAQKMETLCHFYLGQSQFQSQSQSIIPKELVSIIVQYFKTADLPNNKFHHFINNIKEKEQSLSLFINNEEFIKDANLNPMFNRFKDKIELHLFAHQCDIQHYKIECNRSNKLFAGGATQMNNLNDFDDHSNKYLEKFYKPKNYKNYNYKNFIDKSRHKKETKTKHASKKLVLKKNGYRRE